MIDALPSRPLTDAEAEHLKDQDSRFVPLSVLKGGDSPHVIYTIALYSNSAETIHLLGYSEADDGWVEIEAIPQAEWSVDRQEGTIQAWIDEHYGDEFSQGVLDEESGEVTMEF